MNRHLGDAQIIAYLCRTLTDVQRTEFDRHFAGCEACQARLQFHAALQQNIRASVLAQHRRRAPAHATFAQIAPQLKPSRARVRSMWWFNRLVSGAVALAALLALTIWLSSMFNGRRLPADVPAAPAAQAQLPTVQPMALPASEFTHPSTMKLIGQRQVVPAAYGSPTGLALDRRGNLYVIDAAHARILKYDRAGRLVAQWGSAGSGDGQFQFTRSKASGNLPASDIVGDVAVDGSGNVYVADTGNARIQKFDGDGQYLLQWTGGAGIHHLYQPVRLAIDSKNNIYVLDAQANTPQVRRFDSQGIGLLAWTIPITGVGTSIPVGLAINSEDQVYVLDDVTNELLRFDRTEKLSGRWTIHCGSNQLTDLDVGPTGNIYIGAIYSQVCEYDTDGQLLATWLKPDVELLGVSRLAVDPLGSIYLSDSRNSRIEHFALP